MRYKAITEKWENIRIPFKIDRYLYHNFYKTEDFLEITSRFSVTKDQGVLEDEAEKIEEFMDFITYKEGKRIQKII